MKLIDFSHKSSLLCDLATSLLTRLDIIAERCRRVHAAPSLSNNTSSVIEEYEMNNNWPRQDYVAGY